MIVIVKEEVTKILMARNFCKFFRKGNRFRRDNRFGNGTNRFRRGHRNNFGNKCGESLKQKGACYNFRIEGHFTSVESRRRIRLFLEEHRAIVKTTMNIKTTQHDSWRSTLKSGFTKHMTKNRRLFTLYKASDGEHVIFGSNLKARSSVEMILLMVTITNVEHVSGLAFNLISVGIQGNANNTTKNEVLTSRVLELFHLGYSQTSKAYIVLNKETMRIKESLNVTFDESLPEPKSSPLEEDDRIDEPIIQDLNGLPSLQVNVSDEGYPKSLKEAIDHPIEQAFEDSSSDSDFDVDLYLNDEEENRDNVVVSKTPNLKEENRDMFSSINEAIKLMLAVATNMSCVVENDIGKEESKDNLKEYSQEHLEGDALDLWIPTLKQEGATIWEEHVQLTIVIQDFQTLNMKLSRTTNDELTTEEAKQVEADDQAIQTILMGLPEDIYVVVDSCNSAKEIWLHVQQMMKGTNIKNAGNQIGYNAGQNAGIRIRQNAGNLIRLIVVPGFKNQNENESVVAAQAKNNGNWNNAYQIRCYNCQGIEEARVQLQAKEFDLMVVADDCEETEEVNGNCILMDDLQQASTSGTQADKAPVYNSDGSAEVIKKITMRQLELFQAYDEESESAH
nr:integrase, catalytic region, zinc finger, CCHC-type, peptidase aspartic, catalytic [Tanacetum cinerariifolium]